MESQVSTVVSREETIRQAASNPFQLLRETGRRPTLYRFLRMFWNEVAGTNFIDNWHVEFLCRELEEVAYRVARNEPKKHDLIINIPPGTTKTIICSIMFPAWCWAMGWYWMKFITASYSERLALESAEKSRDLIRSDKFKMLFPDLEIKDDKDTKSNFRIGLRTGNRVKYGGNRFSTGVGASTLTGFHGDILIVDDPLNPEQAASEKQLETCNRWVEQTLPTRKTRKETTVMVMVMQRLHQDDPTGRAIKKDKKKLKHICLPGEIRNYKKYLSPPEAEKYYKDDLLDPNRMGWEVLSDLESDLGQYGFAGQIGQNPAPPGGGMFKVDRMPVVDFVHPREILKTVRYWDKAGTAGDGSYTVGAKMSYLRNKTFLIHDIVRGQWSAEVREQIIRKVAMSDGTEVRIYIEQEPGSGGKESAQATIRNLAGFYIQADRPTGEKARRADPFSVQVNNSNVALLRGDWHNAFKEELAMFPFGTYKDQVDASSAAFNMLVGKKEVRVIR